jgi:phenylalanyl-tRNA synthetase alpha chain
MVRIEFRNIKNQAKKEIKEAKNWKELDEIFRKYLGGKGQITEIIKSLKKIPKSRRTKIGKKANELKEFLEKSIEKRTEEIKKKIEKETAKREWVDVTAPGKKPISGHLHPLTQVRREIEEIFQSMGFSIVEGPEIENEWYNFDALNIPKDHPARDVWDTFWLKKPESSKFKVQSSRLLLRTHTSPVQIRFMEKNQPPLRIIVPGSVFRHEATDARHEFQLYQIEGLMVDKEISVAHLKAILAEFFKRFFGKNTDFRLDPDFFPFTEPSFNVSVTCVICGGKGCNLCKNTGWLEMAGAGMVHPNVFKNSGLDPKDWQGWAFGFGLERLAMMKYKIDDIRLFRSGDLRFLNQF